MNKARTTNRGESSMSVCVLAMLFPLPISGISGGRGETKEKR